MTAVKKAVKSTASVAAAPSAAAPAAIVTPTVETIIADVQANTQKVIAEVTAASKDAMKPFTDFQEKLRLGTEQGIEQLRTQYAALKGNAETATDKLEESVAAVHAGSRELNLKVLDLFRNQTNAGFAHVQALFTTKNVTDAVKLQQDFVKTQIETLQAQSKEFTELAKKVASDVVEPVKGSIVTPFKR